MEAGVVLQADWIDPAAISALAIRSAAPLAPAKVWLRNRSGPVAPSGPHTMEKAPQALWIAIYVLAVPTVLAGETAVAIVVGRVVISPVASNVAVAVVVAAISVSVVVPNVAVAIVVPSVAVAVVVAVTIAAAGERG